MTEKDYQFLINNFMVSGSNIIPFPLIKISPLKEGDDFCLSISNLIANLSKRQTPYRKIRSKTFDFLIKGVFCRRVILHFHSLNKVALALTSNYHFTKNWKCNISI